MFFLKAIAFLLVLGLIIVIHEMGHYFAAKWQGIRIAEFAVGFGKKIWSTTRGETDYSIRLIPLGGYVKFYGGELMLGRDEIIEKELKDSDIDPDDPNLLVNRPPLQRFWVLAAGPAMNILLAFLLGPLVFLIGIEEPAYLGQPPIIAHVQKDSPAQQVGLEVGDRILSIDGQPMENWKRTVETVLFNPGQTLEIEVQRGAETLSFSTHAEKRGGLEVGAIGISAIEPLPAVVASPMPDYPAGKAGLEDGDIITRVNDTPIRDWSHMAENIRQYPEEEIRLGVRRGDREWEMTLTTVLNPHTEERAGMIGISPPVRALPMALHRYGPLEAISMGIDRAVNDWLMLMFKSIGALATQRISYKAMAGPVGIAGIIGDQVQQGVDGGDVLLAISMLLNLMGLLSMNIGFLNLLPIPPLDGSHIALLGVEKIKGRALAGIWIERMMKLGVAMLLTLIVMVTYNDVVRMWGHSIGRLFGE